MFELTSLATTPHKQGRGYASTLVRMMTDKVRVSSAVSFACPAGCRTVSTASGYTETRAILEWSGDINVRASSSGQVISIMLQLVSCLDACAV